MKSTKSVSRQNTAKKREDIGMRKIEAATLEEAYSLACRELECSMSELKYEIVQYPEKGLLGFFSKPAVIVADIDWQKRKASSEKVEAALSQEKGHSDGALQESNTLSSEPVTDQGDRRETRKVEALESGLESEKASGVEKQKTLHGQGAEREILEGFFAESARAELSENETHSKKQEINSMDEAALASEIESTLSALMEKSCFEIDVVEVDVAEGTAYIFIDGEDAALLIGKEGYRYNALSYLLYNWLNARYGLHTKLEIAHFLSSQEEMIRKNLEPVIEHVRTEGWGRTRTLDGILVQLALEHLRSIFPDKYVAVKRQRDGKRYVLVNEFNSRK